MREMIWEHFGDFNAKENFHLTPQARRLENPTFLSPHSTLAQAEEIFSPPYFSRFSSRIVAMPALLPLLP
jgi:hypothetical protein